MKIKNKICIERDGIKMGDEVKFKSKHDGKEYTGYVAVIDPNYPKDNRHMCYLLRLKDFNGGTKDYWWDKEWYPEEEKKEEYNCYWASKNEFEVIGSKITNKKTEFKIEDKVRVLSKTVPGFYMSDKELDNIYSKDRIGYIVKIYGDGSGKNADNCLCVDNIKNGYGGNFFAPKDLELIEREVIQEKEAIVHCPTQKLYNKVQKKMLETKKWYGNNKEYHNCWKVYKEKTCLCVLKDNNYRITYGSEDIYQNYYANVPIISAEEYLGDTLTLNTEIPYMPHYEMLNGHITITHNTNKSNFKRMLQKLNTQFKKYLNDDLKAQYRAGFRDGNLALTAYGREELAEIVAESTPSTNIKKEFTNRAKEIIAEEEKKK